MTLERVYVFVLGWAGVSLLVFAFVNAWDVVAYVMLFVGVFGTVLYRNQERLGGWLRRSGFQKYPLFVVLVILLVLLEEYMVYAFSGVEGIMHPNLFVNMTLISVFWLTWLSTWYFYISKKYVFTRKGAILTAGFAGFLYEIIGPLAFMQFPVLAFMTPLSILIYATVAILPMQVMSFTGKNDSRGKYWVATLLPFVITWPIAFVFYLIFTAAGVAL